MRRLTLVAVLVAVSLGLSTVPAAQAATARSATLRTFAVYPQVDAEITMFGTVSSTPAGSQITIQEMRSGSWVNVGTTNTTDAGTYAHSFTPAFSGTRSFRAVAQATPDLSSATSSTLTLSVRSRPKASFDSAPTPKVTGTATVGSLLSIDFGTWSPDLKRNVQWVRDGTVISAASGYQYRLTAKDLGKQITVVVTSTRSDSLTIRESRPGESVREGTFKTGVTVISGSAAVGQSVKAEMTGWTPQPTTFAHQWLRNGVPIGGATAAQYTVTPDDAGTDLTVLVRGESTGYQAAAVTSKPVTVPGAAPTSDLTFGEVMKPYSISVLPSSMGTFETAESPPSWGTNKLTRWDESGAFTHSLVPHSMGTLRSAQLGTDVRHAPSGAEYVSTNSTYKNADVSFDFTGVRFAIEYRPNGVDSDAMVWIDGRPVSGSTIVGRKASAGRVGTRQFIIVTLPERKSVKVRFAGPLFFTGVNTPAADAATITKPTAPFTLGVLSDSFHESCQDPSGCQSRSGGPMLSTVTGFRVWNLAEGGTGYLNSAGGKGAPGYLSSPYGSQRRLEAIVDAPIDALLVHGSYNDKATWTPDQHRAALEKLLADVRQARPDLPVVLAGIEGASYSRPASHYGPLTSNLAGMVGRHVNVVGFIDPYSNPWFTGTGSTATPKGDGNQDKYIGADGYHPNGDGQAYYEGRLADELKDIPLPTGSH